MSTDVASIELYRATLELGARNKGTSFTPEQSRELIAMLDALSPASSSPTPNPVAWMVRYTYLGSPHRKLFLHKSLALRLVRESGGELTPLFDQPSALPATTPSDTPISEAQGYAMHRAFLNVTRPWHARGHTTWALEPEYVSRMFEHVIAAYRNAGGVSPSEGSAPDTPTGFRCSFCRKQKEAVQHMVASGTAAVQICDECVQLCIGLMGLRESPPCAPDTKPDEQAEIAALRAEREAMRHAIAWLLGEEGDFPSPGIDVLGLLEDGKQYRRERGMPPSRPRLYWWRGELRDRWAAAISVGPDNPANLRASSPPEGEDTQRNG